MHKINKNYWPDICIGLFIIIFIVVKTILNNGQLLFSLITVFSLIFHIAVISFSITIITAFLTNHKSLGLILGLLNNGPELICSLLGINNKDLVFATSTSLGAILINIVAIIIASIFVGSQKGFKWIKQKLLVSVILVSVGLSLIFYYLDLTLWIILTTVVSLVLFFAVQSRQKNTEKTDDEETSETPTKGLLIVSIILLLIAGFFLDKTVRVVSDFSNISQGSIGFWVLATLTTWPEFKSSQLLLQKKQYQHALINIAVSNISNLWLIIFSLMMLFLIK